MFFKDCIITDLILWWAIRCCSAMGRGQGLPDYGRAPEDQRHVQGTPATDGLPRLLRIGITSKALKHLLVCQGSDGLAMWNLSISSSPSRASHLCQEPQGIHDHHQDIRVPQVIVFRWNLSRPSTLCIIREESINLKLPRPQIFVVLARSPG